MSQNLQVTLDNARRYEFLRSERLIEMLQLFPTCETCDVGLDYAIDTAIRAPSVPESFQRGMDEIARGEATPFTDAECAEMNAVAEALSGEPEIKRLRSALEEIQRANTREYDGGPDNSLIDDILKSTLQSQPRQSGWKS